MLGYDASQLISVPQQAEGFLLDRLRVPQSPATVTQFTDQTMNWIRKCYLDNNSYRLFFIDFPNTFLSQVAVLYFSWIDPQLDPGIFLILMKY